MNGDLADYDPAMQLNANIEPPLVQFTRREGACTYSNTIFQAVPKRGFKARLYSESDRVTFCVYEDIDDMVVFSIGFASLSGPYVH